MGSVTFETFDPTPYQRVPRLTVEGALALAKALLAAKPADATELSRVADKLQRLVDEVDGAIASQKSEAMPIDYTMQVELDGVTDALWGTLRGRLETWAAFAHPGLTDVIEALGDDADAQASLTAAQKKASQARLLVGQLFGADGLKFTQTTFAEQARTMAGILQLIDKEGIAAQLDALVGTEVLAGLRACQRQYEAMVEGRMAGTERKSADLVGLRGKLQRAIKRYNSAVLLILDEDEPSSLDRVIAALQPVLDSSSDSPAQDAG